VTLEGIERVLLRSRAWRVTRAALPLIFDLDDLPSRAEVLELGAGGGFNAELLLTRFSDWRLLVTDVDPAMVELAQRRLAKWAPRVCVDRVDAAELPYAHDTFDVVVSILVWHHVGDWRRATREAARVLRPGGQLLFADIFRNRRFAGDGRSDHRSVRYTKHGLLELTTRCGFRPRRIRSLNALACAMQAEKTE
jgi:SAM-dependent methyltransferase